MRNTIAVLARCLSILTIAMACMNAHADDAEDEVLAAMTVFHQAEVAGDMDAIMNRYSDEFADPMGTTKAIVHEFFQMAVDSGALSSMEADMQEATITVTADIAVVEPVYYVSGFGPSSYRYTLQKEADGQWRFINSEMLP